MKNISKFRLELMQIDEFEIIKEKLLSYKYIHEKTELIKN
jgi:hypothetical protein